MQSTSCASPQAERFSPDEAHALSKQQVQSFFANGYVIVPQLFTLDEISHLKPLVKTLFEKAKDIAKQYVIAHNITLSTEFRCDYNNPDNIQSASILALSGPVLR
ncbi:hypothetical protein [Candidatus Tisiphia endosymbiont of Nemotelus uliginosus]|uniref:hypothetical protein n=1 Tax=Candidatus Tisiphia endosymbiont of Nemotelus uliginosus TaxID=3077926 RepID=UPI0035C8EFDF